MTGRDRFRRVVEGRNPQHPGERVTVIVFVSADLPSYVQVCVGGGIQATAVLTREQAAELADALRTLGDAPNDG